MRATLGLRWERAVALLAAIVVMMVVALTVVGALPVQAAESSASDDAVVLVADESVDASQYDYGVGSFGSYLPSFSRMGNSWG